MSIQATLGDPIWIKSHEQQLKAMFLEQWETLDQSTMLRIGVAEMNNQKQIRRSARPFINN